jgi:hypothetical protein
MRSSSTGPGGGGSNLAASLEIGAGLEFGAGRKTGEDSEVGKGSRVWFSETSLSREARVELLYLVGLEFFATGFPLLRDLDCL